MRMRIPLTATLVAILALGSVGPNIASAVPLAPVPAIQQGVATNVPLIEVAAKKKRYRSNGNNAAAAAAFAGIAGALIGLAAQESQRDRYYGRGGYGYYDGGRRYYGGPGPQYRYRGPAHGYGGGVDLYQPGPPPQDR